MIALIIGIIYVTVACLLWTKLSEFAQNAAPALEHRKYMQERGHIEEWDRSIRRVNLLLAATWIVSFPVLYIASRKESKSK